jgi:hypothetical protein
MNAIVSIATAASVLVHALFGCCAHHAHDGQTASVRQSIENVAPPNPAACCQHGHKHALSGELEAVAQHSDSKPAPMAPSPCDEGRCTAVLVSKIDSAAPVIAIALPPVCSIATPTQLGNASIRVSYVAQQHHLGPPLRPHLCNLVLLI